MSRSMIAKCAQTGRWARRTAAALIAAAAVAAPGIGRACDLCGIYTATEMQRSRKGFQAGVGEQFSRFATWRDGGQVVPNPGERMNSSVTQLLFGYNFTDYLGVQLNLPIIVRDFRRLEDGELVDGNETGLGDLSLLALLTPYTAVGEESMLRLTLLGGLKLPSGDSGPLREELHEDSEEGPHTESQSGIHGHDLALGSGSVDGIIGAQAFASWRRVFFSGHVQYVIRSEGSFGYDYASDLQWRGGPGLYLLVGDVLWGRVYTLAAQFVLSGETKGKDTMDGAAVEDSAITQLFLGPGFTFTWGSSLSANIDADLPVIQNNTSLQIVPDYRLWGGLTWRF